MLNESPGGSDKCRTSSVQDNYGSKSCFFADGKINKGEIMKHLKKRYIYIFFLCVDTKIKKLVYFDI